MLIVDGQRHVSNDVCDMVISQQVEGSGLNWTNHIFNLRVVPDNSQVLWVVGCSRVFEGTLVKGMM